MHPVFRLILVPMGLAGDMPAMGQEASRYTLSPAQPIVLYSDSSLEATFRFRMQNRAHFSHTAGTGQHADAVDLLVRRFRLKLGGHVLTPRLEYEVQLGLSARDMSIGDGASPPNPLLDVVVRYQLGPNTRIGFGQANVPGGRQALISSGELEFPERPLANSAFTLDRDLGLFAEQFIPIGKGALQAMAAITQGEGRAAGSADANLCYSGRVEWLPFGKFHDEGAYSEGDLYSGQAPRLALATAYSSNRKAHRARAQKGELFPLGEGRTIGTFFADAIFKQKGWAWQSEYSRRLAAGSPLVKDTLNQTIAAVNEGWGMTSQLSRMVGTRSQVAVRHSMVRADASVSGIHGNRDEGMLGYSHYLHGHRVKLQAAVYYTWGDGEMDLDHPGNEYGLMVQVELGI